MSNALDPHLHSVNAPHTESTAEPAAVHPHAPHATPPRVPPGNRDQFQPVFVDSAHHAHPLEGAGAVNHQDLQKVHGNVDAYFKAWTYEPDASHPHRFDPAPAMSLYVDKPHIHDLMLNFSELKRLNVTKNYDGDKHVYQQAMDSLYNSVGKFSLQEVPGSRHVKQINANTIRVDVDFSAHVQVKGFSDHTASIVDRGLHGVASGLSSLARTNPLTEGLAPTLDQLPAAAEEVLHAPSVPVPGRAAIVFSKQNDGSWKIQDERLYFNAF